MAAHIARATRFLCWTKVQNRTASGSRLKSSSPGIPIKESRPSNTNSGVLARISQPRIDPPARPIAGFSPIADQPNCRFALTASGAPSKAARAHCSGELAAHAIRSRLPLICGFREITHAGALFSYAPSLTENWYRLALYADKILKGRKPADLPVEQSSRFELVINVKTAKVLGLEIPPTLLARADEVIE